MRVTQKVSFQNGADDPRGAWSALEEVLRGLHAALNAIDFGTLENHAVAGNLAARVLEYTTNSAANTDDVVRHQLGRTPKWFLQLDKPLRTGETPNAGLLYWGTGPSATETHVTLRCTVASKPVRVLLG